jgi:hypothetical protein
MMKGKVEAWLDLGESRGWACDRCGRTGRGMPGSRCSRCGSPELYRVGLRACPQADGVCRDQRHVLLVDGSPAHARIG